jgi:hypothetical protein
MNRTTRLIGTILLATTCAMAFAAHDAVTLKFARKEGDSAKFKMTADMAVMGVTATLSGNVQDKVTKVSADGYTIESTQSNVQAVVNGSPMPQPDSTDTSSFKNNGELVDYVSEHVSPEAWRIAELSGFVLPDKAVSVGDTWTSTVAADDKKGIVAASATYKLEAMEKVGTHDTAKVKVSYKETAGTDPASSEGYCWIDVKDGSTVKTTATWANVPIQGVLANGTITMERVD